MLNIIKIGGNIIDNQQKTEEFLKAFSHLTGPKILIHGGGKMATELANSLGIESKFIEGKRVTDSPMLKIATMVYAGHINKTLVAKLQALGTNSIGLSGADANTIPSLKRKDGNIDWGYVGDVKKEEVNINFIEQLITMNMVPVFCAITHDNQGQLLNTNADSIASALASSMAKAYKNVQLVYCFEKKGVLMDLNDEQSVIKTIVPSYYEKLKQKNIIHTGMIPKLDSAFKSIREGVSTVKICMAEDLNDLENAGTSVMNE